MVTKKQKSTDTDKKSGAQLAGTIKESAQQIWLAGLGAFSRAQDERGKAFESLVKEGVSIQRKTQAAAEEKISEATSRMASMATEISSKASGQWGKLEDIFEDRVAKALNKLGVPSAKDINALELRVDELNAKLAKYSASAKPAARAAAPASGSPSSKAAAERPAKPASVKRAASNPSAKKTAAKSASAAKAPARTKAKR